MTVHRPAWLAVALYAACGNITATEEGVVSLVLFVPQPAEVEVGQALALRAAALDGDGDTLDVPIIWRALDTTLVVDSTSGVLTGRTLGETGRVIARVGELFSPAVTFNVVAPADTLIRIAAETLFVAPEENLSGELTVELRGGEPLEPVAGRKVVFQVVEPVFPDPEDRTVELSGGVLLAAPRTTATGSPPGLRLQRRDGFASPAEAIVEVSVYRPGGEALPGSGLRFVIVFAP